MPSLSSWRTVEALIGWLDDWIKVARRDPKGLRSRTKYLMQSIFDAMKDFQRGVWRAVYLTEDDHRILFTHHRAIVDAIRARDAELASKKMMDHLSFAEQRSIAYVARHAS